MAHRITPDPGEVAERDRLLAGVRDYTTLCADIFDGFRAKGFTREDALQLVMVWMELMHDDAHRFEM